MFHDPILFPLSKHYLSGSGGGSNRSKVELSHERLCASLGVTPYSQLDLKGKTVLIRVDGNLDPKADAFKYHPRAQQVYKTLSYFLSQGAKVVVISHLSEAAKPTTRATSMKAAIVKKLLDEFPDLKGFVKFVPFASKELQGGVLNEELYFERLIRRIKRNLKPGHAIFLEDSRLFKSEKNFDPRLRSGVNEVIDIAVHDGFAVSHRNGFFPREVLNLFPVEKKALGPCSCEEWSKFLEFGRDAKDRSIALVLGGDRNKFKTKLKLVAKLLENPAIGLVYLGGVFGTAYLRASGSKLGRTPTEKDFGSCLDLLNLVECFPQIKFVLPDSYKGINDGKIAQWTLKGRGINKRVEIPDESYAQDQAPADFNKIFAGSGITRVLAVGPLGNYLDPQFSAGTIESYGSLHEWASESNERLLYVGGGNSVESLMCESNNPKFRRSTAQVYMSAGGGAAISALDSALRFDRGEQINMPVLEALRKSLQVANL